MILIMFFSFLLHAEPKVGVWVRDPAAAKAFLPEDKFQYYDAEAQENGFREDGYLQPRQRSALFHKLQLEEALNELDDLDKDRLVMGAAIEKDTNVLQRRFPMLTHKQIKALQKEMKEYAQK